MILLDGKSDDRFYLEFPLIKEESSTVYPPEALVMKI